MNNPYDVHSWSKLYREERLAESQVQRLARKDGSRLGWVSLLLVMVVLATAILLGTGCTEPTSSTVDTDTNVPDHTASASSSSSGDSSDSASSVSSSSASSDGSTDSASPSASASASSSSSSSASASSSSSDTDASNFAGMRSSTSWECYTFYSDGTVELRHGGTSTISDSGSFQGDEDFGEIVWDSGRWTSTVVAEGDDLIIDDLKVSPVESCF
jgi:cytoskeletal protein RodZ